MEEILENVKLLKNNKSEGVDFIKNEYIKNCPERVTLLAVSLFNLVLKTDYSQTTSVSSSWALDNIGIGFLGITRK